MNPEKIISYLVVMILSVSVGLFTIGCSQSDDGGGSNGPSGPQPGGSNSATITTANGGSVSYGNFDLEFPAGAIDNDTEFTVSIPTTEPTYVAPPDVEQIGYIYMASPSMAFNAPVTVTFDYTDNQIGIYDETSLRVWRFATEGAAPELLNNISVDAAANEVTGTTTQFSYFLLTISTAGFSEPPETPTLVSPASESTNQPLTVTLTWETALGAMNYNVKVATDANFNNLVEDASVSGTSYTLGGLTEFTTYYWKVQAVNEFGSSDWSNTWYFETGEGGGSSGNLDGTWVYDHADYDIQNPIPGYTIELDGWGNTVLNMNNGNYTAAGTEYTSIYVEYNGIVFVDETTTTEVDEGGTYTDDGNTVTFTTTYDNIDPGNVGTSQSFDYVINGNVLALTYEDDSSGYASIATAYFNRQ